MKRNNRKKGIVKPDETFSSGPFQMARFGRHVVSRMNWRPGDFEVVQERLAASYDDIVAEIDSAVEEAAELVSTLPPLELMHRAWWIRAAAMIGIESEFDVGHSEILAERMVDYVQSLICGYPPAAEKKDSVSDEDWERLKSVVQKIFETINSVYFISATAKRRKEGSEISPSMEEFYFLSQFYWVNVKAAQYQVHQIQALRELLSDQSLIVEKLYGLNSEDLCNELAKLQHAQVFGISEAFGEMRKCHENFVAALDSDISSGSLENGGQNGFVEDVIERHGLRNDLDRVAGLVWGYDLLDVGRNTTLSESFMRDFAWRPGEDCEFFSDGSFKGWPLRLWPTFKRPFLNVEDKYYLFDSSTLFDRIYRQIEKRAFALGESDKQKWIATRKRVTEDLPFVYLNRILPGARVVKGVYYEERESGKAAKWYELDGIVAFDDHLFIVEVKAGAYTYTSPTTDVDAHVKSLKSLVTDPANQGNRFFKYLQSAAEVALYDEAKKEIDRMRLADYRHVAICAVTLDQFTEIAAQSQRLSNIGISIGERPVWSVSIDDLRVYADIFDNPFEFLHFVEQRNKALDSKDLQLDDELDHLGLYLKHNHYELHARELVDGKDTKIRFTGYREEVDKFFSKKMKNNSEISPLRQELPDSLYSILILLNGSRKIGGSRLACHLLDLSGDLRKSLFGNIEERLQGAGGDRVGPMSTTGEVRITVQPWSGKIDSTDLADIVDLVKAMLVLNNETDRLLLVMHYDSEKLLQDVTWHWISKGDINSTEFTRIQGMAENLRSRRLLKATAIGKIGRNELCPCGSGKKYKKCCLGRPK